MKSISFTTDGWRSPYLEDLVPDLVWVLKEKDLRCWVSYLWGCMNLIIITIWMQEGYGGKVELLSLLLLLLLSRATPMAHRSSQSRGESGVAPAGLCHSHSNAGSELHLGPTPQLTQPRIPSVAVSKDRDRIHLLMDTSQICFLCTTMGIPEDGIIKSEWAMLVITMQHMFKVKGEAEE